MKEFVTLSLSSFAQYKNLKVLEYIRKKIFQKGKRHSSLFINVFQLSSNYFYFRGTLTM